VRGRRARNGDDRRAAQLSQAPRHQPIPVADAGDPRLADYLGLRDPAHRQRYEAERGIFVAEGALTIRALLRSPYPVRSLLLTSRQWEALAADVTAAGCPAPVLVAERSVLAKVAGFDIHRGAVAAADRLPPNQPAAVLPGGPAVVAVAEGINDHENLGALFRNAAAFGVAAVLLDPTGADPLYRRSVRVSLGHVLHVPSARLAPWPEGLDELRAAGFELVALTPAPGAEPIDELADHLGDRVALLVGAEGPGLSVAALAAADHRATIPMAPEVDSINVATAAAVALHVLARRRRQARS
jgi:tRNA G18 (ribose-2'-O)-methylase SpoU